MHKLLKALQCQNDSGVPIWLMRQAGRYLPAYRKLKEGRSLFTLFHDPESIVTITLLPFELLKLDAAILFSDILTVLDGLNLRYDFQEGIGPCVLDSATQLRLIEPAQAYQAVISAIQLLKRELTVPLLGFAGAPFTVASYIIEGKTSRDLKTTKQWLFQKPESFFSLLDQITEATIAYLHAQIDAGVDAVQLFDSWANALGPQEFETACLGPMKKIIQAIKPRVPVILFCRNSCLFADQLASIHPTAISFDWSGDLVALASRLRHTHPHLAIQGNLDPMALYGTQQGIREKVDTLLNALEDHPGYIFNLGHGILPDVPLENVQFLVEYVHNRSRAFAQVQ